MFVITASSSIPIWGGWLGGPFGFGGGVERELRVVGMKQGLGNSQLRRWELAGGNGRGSECEDSGEDLLVSVICSYCTALQLVRRS